MTATKARRAPAGNRRPKRRVQTWLPETDPYIDAAAGFGGGNDRSTAAISFTVLDGAQVLAVAVMASSQASGVQSVGSVTLGAANLALWPSSRILSSATGTSRFVEVWWIANPTPGTQTLTINLTGGSPTTAALTGLAFTLRNVDTTTPFGTLASQATASTNAPTAAPAAPGDFYIAIESARTTPTVTPGTGQMTYLNQVSGTGGNLVGVVTTDEDSAAQTFAWTTASESALLVLPVLAPQATVTVVPGTATATGAGVATAGAGDPFDFEFGTTTAAWTPYGTAGATVALSSTQTHHGTQAMQVNWTTSLQGVQNASFTGLTVGQAYTFTIWVYVGGVTGGSVGLGVNGIFSATRSSWNNAWGQLSITAVPDSTGTALVQVNVIAATARTDYVDDVAITATTVTTATGAGTATNASVVQQAPTTATATGVATASSVSTINGTATATGAGVVTTVVTQAAGATATGAGTATAASPRQQAGAAATGAGAVTTVATQIAGSTAAGAGVATASSVSTINGTATATGAGVVTTSVTQLSATVTATGAGVATATPTLRGAATATGAGVASNASIVQGVVATATGAGTATNASNIQIAGATATGAGTVTANSGGNVSGTATATGAGVATATATQVAGATATGAGAVTSQVTQRSSTVTATGAGVVTTVVTIQGTATATAAGTATAAVTLQGTATPMAASTVTTQVTQRSATVTAVGAGVATAQSGGAPILGTATATAVSQVIQALGGIHHVYTYRLVPKSPTFPGADGPARPHDRRRDRTPFSGLQPRIRPVPVERGILLWRDGRTKTVDSWGDYTTYWDADDRIAGGYEWVGSSEDWQSQVLLDAGFTLEVVGGDVGSSSTGYTDIYGDIYGD